MYLEGRVDQTAEGLFDVDVFAAKTSGDREGDGDFKDILLRFWVC